MTYSQGATAKLVTYYTFFIYDVFLYYKIIHILTI